MGYADAAHARALVSPCPRLWIALALLLVGGIPGAWAGDPPADPPADPLGARASAVLAAAADPAALGRLAADDDPDPWRVADALLLRREAAAARAFAAASTRPAFEGLAAWVEAQVAAPVAPARREALARQRAARDAPTAEAARAAAVGPDDVVTVDAFVVDGDRRAAGGDLAGAVAAYRAAAEVAARLPWRTGAAEAWRQAARRALQRGDLATGLACADARLVLETALGSRAGVARTEHQRAALLRLSGRADDARAALDRAEAAARAADDRESLGNVLGERAMMFAEAGRGADALPLLDAALEAYAGAADHAGEPRFRPDAAKVERYLGQTQVNRAEVLRDLGRTADARLALEAALASALRAGDRQREGTARSRLATVLASEGRRVEALAARRAAVVALDAAGLAAAAANERRLASSLSWALGDLEGALADAERAVADLGRLQSAKDLVLARVQAALVRSATGPLAAARAHADAAVALATTVGDAALVARARAARARCAYLEGDLAAADADFTAASAAGVGLPRATRFELGMDAGPVLLRVGRTKAARTLYERLAAEAEAAGDRDAAYRARLGVIEVERADGDPEAVAAAIDAAAALVDPAAPTAVVLRLQRADVRLAAGDAVGALDEARGALADATARRSAREAATARVGIVRALTALGRPAEAAAAATEALAAAADVGTADLEADAALAAAAAYLVAGDPDASRAAADRALERSWRFGRFLADAEGASARARVASAALYGVEACLARADLEGAFAFAERGRAVALAESLGLRDALAGTHASPAAVAEEEAARSAEALAAAALAEAVADGDRAVVRARRLDLEAARTRHLDVLARFAADAKSRAGLAFPAVASAADVRRALAADEAYVAYVTNGARGLALVVTAAGVRAAPLPPLTSLEDALGPEDAGALDALRAAVVAPLALPATVRRVVVCPMGAALDVPYAALLPDVDVAVAPSAGIWLRQRGEAARTGEGVLALGDPDYDGSARGTPRATTWVRLPGTGVEAKAVGTEVLLRGDATEARFRAAVVARPRWSAVHCACHGAMDLRQPLRSALALAPEAGDDGLLTAAEVYRLPVRSDLVVLSGCETARAHVVEGEGPLGLARAFFVAGTPRVIVALWKVDDAATSAPHAGVPRALQGRRAGGDGAQGGAGDGAGRGEVGRAAVLGGLAAPRRVVRPGRAAVTGGAGRGRRAGRARPRPTRAADRRTPRRTP